jgi:predicted dehydrogenase
MKRRDFIKTGALSTISAALVPSLFAQSRKTKKVKIAICGLGRYAENQIAPAINESEFATITAIITASNEKIPKWQKLYNISSKNIYNYDNLDSISNNPDIDCVYICTPTGNHAEYTIRSFQAGKHVICEKPMAPTVKDCDKMIEAAKKAKKSLQIGYRLYWDPFNISLIESMKSSKYGDWTQMSGGFSFKQGKWRGKGDWKLTKAMGVAGSLYDLGVYVVQSAFYSAQNYPLSVKARSWTDRVEIYKEIPEHWEWELEWPNGKISKHSSSYGKYENFIHLETEMGKLGLKPAYSYSGIKGYTPVGDMKYSPVFQQKLQIDNQCLAILNKKPNITPGEMGRRDIRVLNAIMESAKTKKKVIFEKFKY